MKKGILCAIDINSNDDNFKNSIDECVNLATACDIEIINVFTQKARTIDKTTGMRKGKILEIKNYIDENKDIEIIIFNNNLSFSILKRIEETIGIEVIDRTTLILDIFALRATSRAAKIQTEIARLKYNLPKLLNLEIKEDRARGGDVVSRGKGESKISIVKKKIEHDLAMLRNELKNYQTHTTIQANKRNKTNIKKVALIGYTNAGKSSLMTVLSKDDKVFVKDMLFATLDTTVRNIKHKNYEFYLFDTVGFVSDLPHDLIDAFKTTLSAAKDADLLLNIIDSSNANYLIQKEITLKTLKDIGATGIEIIDVYNKADLLESMDDDKLYISTKNNYNIELLLEKIIEKLYPKQNELKCLIPYSKLYLINNYKNIMSIEIVENNEIGSIVNIKGDDDVIKIFYPYKI